MNLFNWKHMAVTLIAMLLSACTTTQPVPFKTGKQVAPPSGCIEYRQRGGEC